MAHDARVRLVNPREVTFPHKVRGRVTGTDRKTVHDGYQPYCECGWTGAVTSVRTTATAHAAGHNDHG